MTADGRPVSYLGRGVVRKEMEKLTAALGGPLPSWTDSGRVLGTAYWMAAESRE